MKAMFSLITRISLHNVSNLAKSNITGNVLYGAVISITRQVTRATQ